MLGATWALLATAAAGCIAISSGDDVQCETDTDCTSRGADFANTICTEEQVCAPIGSTGCTSNAQCTEELGEPALCREVGGECVKLLSEDCVRVVGDTTQDNVVPIGFLFPAKGDLAFLADIGVPFMELAIQEFESQGGLPGPAGTKRHLALVVCDELVDVTRAARHLVDDIGVPGIIGPGISDYALAIGPDIAFPKNTFLILPAANSEATENLPDSKLLWHMRSTEDRQARALVELVTAHLEPKIREDNELTEDDDIKVLVFHRDDDQGNSMSQFIQDYLVFNGERALDQPDNYRQIPFPTDCLSETTIGECFADVVNGIRDLEPHVIFGVGQLEMHSAMQIVEEGWPTGEGAAPRPYWLFSDGAFAPDPLLGIVANDDDLRQRVIGIWDYFDFEADIYKKFAIKFEGQFSVPPEPGFEVLYDAMMVTGYAIAAASQAQNVTGQDMAAGMGRIVGPGPKIEVGAQDMSTAFGTLGANAAIDLVGLTGELDFDVLTGSFNRDWVLWCLAENPEAPDDPPGFDLSGRYAVWRSGEDRSPCPFADDPEAPEAAIDCGRFDPGSTFSCE